MMPVPRLMGRGLATFGVLAGSLAFSGAPAFAAPPEKPLTKPATAIAGTSATLHGEINPGVSAEEAEYDFAYSGGALCTEGGLIAPELPGRATGNHKEVPATPVTGLEGSTVYTFCLVATNISGSTLGSQLTFKTLAARPVVVGEPSSSSVTPFEATLEAQINPENQSTTLCKFEYGLTTKYGKATAECEQGVLGGSSIVPASAHAQGLEANTTYHYRVVVKNATGESKGVDGTFTTLTAEPPIVVSESFSGLTSTDAKLEAKVNPTFQETGYYFEYSTKAIGEVLEGFVTTVAGAPPAPFLTAVFEEQLAGPVDLGGALTPGQTYFYRIVAKNGTGEAKGAVQSFQALATPAVTTGAAQNLTRSSATFSGTVNPAGAATTYHFAYVAAAEYEPLAANPYAKGRTTSENTVGSDYTVHAVGPLGASELQPEVTYHYAVIATNSLGTTIGPDVEFATSAPTPPIAVTGAAGEIAPTTAVVAGTLDTRGLQTSYEFELGTEAGSYFPQGFASAGSAAGAQAVSLQLSYLALGVIYHYRLCATNQDGTTCGADQTFATPGVPNHLIPPATRPLLPTPNDSLAGARVAGPATTKSLTNAQKLANALKVCRKKPKTKRANCAKQARKKYGTAKKKKKKKKKTNKKG